MWIARPISTHRHVKKKEERVVINPAGPAGQGGGGHDMEHMGVNHEANEVRFPVNTEEVELRSKFLTCRQGIRLSNPMAAGIAGSMDSSVNGSRLAPYVLHDVDFTAARPTNSRIMDVGSKHPESGPNPLPEGHLDTAFNSSIFH